MFDNLTFMLDRKYDFFSAGGTAASVVSGATWLGLGEANSGLTFGNAIVEGRTYDLDLRPLALTETGTSNAVLQKLTYAYDADDNVTSIADGVNSANSQSFVYDTLNRVTHASGAYGALCLDLRQYRRPPVGAGGQPDTTS